MLQVHNLTVSYGAEPVLDNASLSLEAGAFVSLVGPSGSGKSSILRAIMGLQRPEAGTIDLQVAREQIGFLFQDDALLPWRSARDNVALGLRVRGLSRAAARAQADTWLGRVGLSGFEHRYPAQLSGGQRKRVALAQVLALKPRLLLMDEPFAALDAIVRQRITEELLGWVERERLTVLLVTHDLEEALSLSDTIYLLSRGPRAQIRRAYDVPLPRPRDLVESRTHPAFAPLLKRLWHDLALEVDGAAPYPADALPEAVAA
jgi:NitT/TauT family transport system ATP-binding protein